jgi:hypothetical protein
MRATPSGRRISLGNEPLAGAVPLYGADGNKAAVFVGGGPVVDETKMTRPCLPVPAALLHQRCLLQPGPGEAAAAVFSCSEKDKKCTISYFNFI